MARKTTADPIKGSSTKVSAAKKASPKKKAETPGKSRSGTKSVTQNTKLSAGNEVERELKTPRRYKEGSTKQKTRRGKSPEDLEDDVEVMAEKVGIELPEDEKQKEEEVESAIEATSDRPYREYSKQGALEKLKKTHKVTENKAGEGDPFSDAARRAPKSKRGINAPPSEEEKDVPPTKRHTKAGDMSERSKVTNEKNRPLADALYELADFVLHGDAIQKGLSYQKAAKSVREAKQPITSKDVALKLTGVGKSVGGKIEEYVKEGKIQVLEEYRSGKRGK
ncbi:hypothetical protein NSK_007585 [Nannochloropsis salina CCMP1776]|uniref:Crossover junction endonuclease MUS81-like HHH domain-containing protein n=1 Tax=Nannochloropsis salina CCMP1776 TaxID=1027361 RepID=A0A4D9CP55_9STRA|nr:hypothetical protein NSK_007585 [Nannochloropsis salina CCMP1776]|eukprot:TFJ80942.1 hypothetical protein NSK_007585 [Nannochloropsis salina CCMP1776]